jgi:hypothetical protein
MPLPDPMEATEGLPLVHAPPPVASVNVMDRPSHTAPGPDMAAGTALTVTVVVAMQLKPEIVAYVTIAVPWLTP